MEGYIRVVVVADQPVIAWGLRAALATSDDMVVVAETDTTAGIEQVCQQQQAHVLLLDTEILSPGMSDVITQVKRACADIAVVILSTAPNPVALRLAQRLGVAAYLLKTDPMEEVVTTIHAVAKGATWTARQTMRKLIATSADRFKVWELTPREVEVLRALAQGYSNKAIAAHLRISVYTVRNCTVSIFKKIGVTTRTSAVVWALAHHITDVPP